MSLIYTHKCYTHQTKNIYVLWGSNRVSNKWHLLNLCTMDVLKMFIVCKNHAATIYIALLKSIIDTLLYFNNLLSTKLELFLPNNLHAVSIRLRKPPKKTTFETVSLILKLRWKGWKMIFTPIFIPFKITINVRGSRIFFSEMSLFLLGG